MGNLPSAINNVLVAIDPKYRFITHQEHIDYDEVDRNNGVPTKYRRVDINMVKENT